MRGDPARAARSDRRRRGRAGRGGRCAVRRRAYALSVLTEAAIAVLFASSLHVMMGPAAWRASATPPGSASGAYAAASLRKMAGAPMAAGARRLRWSPASRPPLFGTFVVRLSGVYLAMLTLAFAQILWAVAFQWVALTGGDNGIVGVWPAAWAQAARVSTG